MFFEDGKNLFLFSNKPKQDLYRSHFFTKKWDIFFTFMEGVFHGEGTAKEHVCHNLIIGVLIQSCPPGAKNFTNYVFCHPQFSGVIQNIENHCAIRVKF